MEFELRPLTADALDAVAEMEQMIFSEPWSRAALELLLGDGYVALAVQETSGRTVGYAGMLLAPNEGQIINVAVHPDARGQGLGRLLMQGLIAAAREKKLAVLSLEVRAGNERAIGLYRSLGFSVVGQRKNFYKRPTEDARVMLLEL